MNKIEDFVGLLGAVTMSLYKSFVLIYKIPVLYIGTGLSIGLSVYWGDNRLYLEALSVCLFFNTVTGGILAFKEDRFTIVGLCNVFMKVVVYAMYLIILHFVTRLDVLVHWELGIEVITKLLLTGIIVNEGRSAVDNGDKLYPNWATGFIRNFFDKIENGISKKSNENTK